MIITTHLDFSGHHGVVPSAASWSHYLPASPILRDSGLACRGAGEQGDRPPMTPRRLPTHGLLFVTAGRGSYRGEPYRSPVAVVAPAVIWLFPGVQHHYEPDDDAGWREHWVLFEGTAVRAYEGLQAWRRDRPVARATGDLDAALGPLFGELRRATSTPGRQAELLGATACHALIGLAAARTGHQMGVEGTDQPESAAAAVVRTALSPGSVADRARQAGRNPEELRRAVRTETSLSVHELVIRTRLDRAQSLLATTAIPVAAVARQVGYDDPAYFSRVFTARTGLSPSAFRRQLGR